MDEETSCTAVDLKWIFHEIGFDIQPLFCQEDATSRSRVSIPGTF